MTVQVQNVAYTANDADMEGYLAYDDSIEGARPGVLVVHEWWGLDDYIRGRARMLAELGYTALAVDMYGTGKRASTPDDAGKLMNEVLGDMAIGEQRFAAAVKLLTDQSTTDAGRLAAIGYCFGGAIVLHSARIGLDLKGVVSFHGALGSFHKARPGQRESARAGVPRCRGCLSPGGRGQQFQGRDGRRPGELRVHQLCRRIARVYQSRSDGARQSHGFAGRLRCGYRCAVLAGDAGFVWRGAWLEHSNTPHPVGPEI